ncbi:MAG: flagellar basal body-associated FliL family protein [Deltaproteobacteria bacterium]|nr:flagellar basal body-associated FliL family protein [Deltaproteobacteria bacterium]
MPQIKDSLLVLLSSKTFIDIKTVEGKMRLRMEIIGRINNFLTSGRVKNVYFTEFVVQ